MVSTGLHWSPLVSRSHRSTINESAISGGGARVQGDHNGRPGICILDMILVEPGEKEDLQVCICSTKEGSFSFNLFCQLENCDKVVSLPISGKVEVCSMFNC